MTAVWIIAALTVKDASRRRVLLGALVMGLMVLGVSLLLLVARHNMEQAVLSGRSSPVRFAIQYSLATSAFVVLCLSAIKALSGLFAALLAGGAVSGEIERGILPVILARPVRRVELLAGKWLGINLVLVGSCFTWTFLAWASLTWQTGLDLTALLRAGPYLALFPVLVSTVALTFSTFAQRLFGTILAVAVASFAWMDGVLNSLATAFQAPTLRVVAIAGGLLLPQGYVGWWVEGATQDIMFPGAGVGPPWSSPRFVTEWGARRLHFTHMDAIYVAMYVAAAFFLGVVIFNRRDVAG